MRSRSSASVSRLLPQILLLFSSVGSLPLTKHHDVYWNSTNSLFEPFDNAIDSPGYFELSAAPSDVVRFHCPSKGSTEFSRIYRVSEDDFVHCVLSEDAQLVASCDISEHSLVVKHVLHRHGSQTSNYYISTSSGQIDGLDNRRLGLCLEKNMRIAVHLGPMQLKPLHESIYGMDLDAERLSNEQMYLAEENGAINWKKNVHPQIEEEMDRELTELRRKFEKSRQMEPIPIDDAFVNRLEEYRRKHETDVALPEDVRVLDEVPSSSTGSNLVITFVIASFLIFY